MDRKVKSSKAGASSRGHSSTIQFDDDRRDKRPSKKQSSKSRQRSSDSLRKDSRGSSSSDVSSKKKSSHGKPKFIPMPYTFRIPAVPAREVKNSSAKCPPFYLQLDHALAVIWCLFSHKEVGRPLGIAQLQWALNFLKGIYSQSGKNPKDVALCIRAIEDRLIEQYADLVDDIKHVDPKGSKCCGCIKKKKSSATGRPFIKEQCSDYNDLDVIAAADMETTQPSSMKLMPFSVNYDEMIKYNPVKVEQIYKAKSQCSCSAHDVSKDRLKDFMNFDSEHGSISITDKTDKENMVKFLTSWRKEQIEKIQDELKRLRSIDNYIENVDKNNFVPFLDEKQLDVLVASKVSSSAHNKPHKKESKEKHKEKDRDKSRRKSSSSYDS